VRLKPRQLCPIHRLKTCCGRAPIPRQRNPKYKYLEPGVRLTEDGRQLRSSAAMRRLVDQKIREQCGFCGICGEELTDYRDVVGAHKHSKKMGGWARDDSPHNIVAAHSQCNLEMGSKEIA
jgi:5-methylcytosine-specific restriction endonuclease McrA